MRGVVIYESMFGNTRLIAEAIAEGLGEGPEMRVRRAADCAGYPLTGLEVLVVGAPTHAHSMPRISTRRGVPNYTAKPGSALTEEPGAAHEPGVRELLESLGALHGPAAAFDTRLKGPAFLTGRASRAIARALRRRGLSLVLPPESFLVDRQNRLLAGEVERARLWGVRLAEAINGPLRPIPLDDGRATRSHRRVRAERREREPGPAVAMATGEAPRRHRRPLA